MQRREEEMTYEETKQAAPHMCCALGPRHPVGPVPAILCLGYGSDTITWPQVSP